MHKNDNNRFTGNAESVMSQAQCCLQLVKMVVGRCAHHGFPVVVALLREHVVKEFLAIWNGKVAEAALAVGIIDKVLVSGFPVKTVGRFPALLFETVSKPEVQMRYKITLIDANWQ